MVLLFMVWLTALLAIASAKTHTYNFNATYVRASPDGVQERRVIGINNEWPLPEIRVKKGDRVIINFTNGLGNRNTSLHFHGLFQRDTVSMDGPEMVTQCPIPPGHTFIYNFTVPDQTGTYWYHSHSGAQYSDGLRGLFVIEEQDKSLVPFEYDEEVTLSVSDWYHLESTQLMSKFLSRYNPTGAEPIPQNALFNDTRNVTWEVKPDTTYFLRIVNMGMFVSQYLFIEDHNFTIVEVDGVYVEPQETDSLLISVAQRIGVLVHTKQAAHKNYRFVNVIDQEMLDILPEDLEIISTNWIKYNDYSPLRKALKNTKKSFDSLVSSLNPFDDFDLIPSSKQELLPEPDKIIELNFTMDNLGNGVNYAFFNNITYVAPKVPTLITALSSGDYAINEMVYGSNTNSFILQHNDIIEIVVNNMDAGKHPFHLHGHAFQIISRSEGTEDDEDPEIFDPSNPKHTKYPNYPSIRDTVLVNSNGFVVIRFKADNPGIWFFHCHVDWHLEQGLAITLVEAPLELQQNELPIPKENLQACKKLNIPIVGNAAGRSGDSEAEWLDLTGEPIQFAPLPEGFTFKGYLAFALCTLVALYGVFSIYRYGMEDVNTDENEALIAKLYLILQENGALNEEESRILNNQGERVTL